MNEDPDGLLYNATLCRCSGTGNANDDCVAAGGESAASSGGCTLSSTALVWLRSCTFDLLALVAATSFDLWTLSSDTHYSHRQKDLHTEELILAILYSIDLFDPARSLLWRYLLICTDLNFTPLPDDSR